MSTEFVLRILGMIVFAFLGTELGTSIADDLGFRSAPEWPALILMFTGALAGLVLTPWFTTRPARAARRWIGGLSSQTLLAAVLGLLCGLVMSALLSVPLSELPRPFNQYVPTIVAIIAGYLNVFIFVSRARDVFTILSARQRPPGVGLGGLFGEQGDGGRRILMDTSVIIDGRIADISKLGFIGGALVVPRFILSELQHIADSSDTLRRNRGRRGLEILNRMQRDSHSPVQIIDDDIEGVRDADDKLILLAKQYQSPIMTNDYNLNRVAELQGVSVLNINELANAVKAVFLPGEEMTIHVLQEGREVDQGVGYLDDGTMVVIEEGKRYIDRTIEVVVTKHIQTPAGRMIFARPTDLEGHPNRSR
jgi:uncharacterized protein YacL